MTQQSNKTFTERFMEVEDLTKKLSTELESINNKVESIMSAVGQLAFQVRLINEQIQAMYDLFDLGKPITRSSVIEKANERRVAMVREMIDSDVKNGLIKPIDTIKTPENLVTYRNEDVLLAIQTANAFVKGDITIDSILNKKVGDKIGDSEILEIYEAVPQNEIKFNVDDKGE